MRKGGCETENGGVKELLECAEFWRSSQKIKMEIFLGTSLPVLVITL